MHNTTVLYSSHHVFGLILNFKYINDLSPTYLSELFCVCGSFSLMLQELSLCTGVTGPSRWLYPHSGTNSLWIFLPQPSWTILKAIWRHICSEKVIYHCVVNFYWPHMFFNILSQCWSVLMLFCTTVFGGGGRVCTISFYFFYLLSQWNAGSVPMLPL